MRDARGAEGALMGKLLPFVLVLVLSSALFADGGMATYRPQTGTWQVSHESRQLAAINYQDGVEKMLLAVEPSDLTGTKLVWVFPVPSKPESVKIGLAEEFPQFSGQNIDKKAAESVQGAGLGLLGSQVFLAPLGIGLLGFFPGMSGSAGGARSKELGAAGWTPWYDTYIDIHSSIEKNGLVTELVETRTGGALYYYLKGKELDVPYEMQATLDGYAGKDYSFVVTYIENMAEFKRLNNISGKQAYPYRSANSPVISVSVEFPTDKIYYPLVPTSIYKETSVPAWIYVMGHVTPGIYPDIRPDTKVEYYTGNYPYTQKTDNFFGKYNFGGEFKFTKIYISTPSANFVQDLWMENAAPPQVALADFAAKNGFMVSVLLFALFSCLASYLSGIYIFKGAVEKKRLALAGLSNFLTVIGFIFTAIYLIKPSKHVGEHCRVKFAGLFSAICIAFGILLIALPGAIGGNVSSASYSLLLIPFAFFFGCIVLPQIIAAYAYLHFMKIGRGRLFYPIAFAVLDVMPIIAAYGALAYLLRDFLLPAIIVLAIVLLTEGYLLALIDKKTFAPRKGFWTVALMKGAAILACLCVYGALMLLSQRGISW